MANEAPADQSKATTNEGKKEVDRMRRAREASSGIWGASKWLLALLGAVAPFTFGLQLAKEGADRTPLQSIIIAVIVVIVGAICYAVIQIITASRTRTADRAARSRGGAYFLLLFLFIGQILALPLAAYFQGKAVYQTLEDTGRDLDLRLAERIELYEGSAQALDVVKEYCDEHLADNQASNTFLNTCVRFNQKLPPKSNEAQELVAQLRGEAT